MISIVGLTNKSLLISINLKDLLFLSFLIDKFNILALFNSIKYSLSIRSEILSSEHIDLIFLYINLL